MLRSGLSVSRSIFVRVSIFYFSLSSCFVKNELKYNRCFTQKVVPSFDEAVKDISSGNTLSVYTRRNNNDYNI